MTLSILLSQLTLQAPSVIVHLPTQLDADADFIIPKPPVPNVLPCSTQPHATPERLRLLLLSLQVNLSILYAALSPPSRIVDPDENWDTQRWSGAQCFVLLVVGGVFFALRDIVICHSCGIC